MVKPRHIAGLVIALTVAAVLFTPIANTVAENSGDQDVVNETVTAQHGQYVDLDGYNIVSDSETVYYTNDTDGSTEVATRGTDYEMNYSAGSIQALENGSISDGEEIDVSYTYEATDSSTTTVVTMVPLFVALLMLGVMAARIQDAM